MLKDLGYSLATIGLAAGVLGFGITAFVTGQALWLIPAVICILPLAAG